MRGTQRVNPLSVYRDADVALADRDINKKLEGFQNLSRIFIEIAV